MHPAIRRFLGTLTLWFIVIVVIGLSAKTISQVLIGVLFSGMAFVALMVFYVMGEFEGEKAYSPEDLYSDQPQWPQS